MAEKKTQLPGDLVANFDQFDQHLENSGRLMGTYYKSLLASGVPKALAADLVREFNSIFFSLLGKARNNEST